MPSLLCCWLALQVRGPKKHLKRLNAPHHWMTGKLGGIYAPKVSAGPHKSRECLPMVIIVRNRMKYALTRTEAQAICMQKLVRLRQCLFSFRQSRFRTASAAHTPGLVTCCCLDHTSRVDALGRAGLVGPDGVLGFGGLDGRD